MKIASFWQFMLNRFHKALQIRNFEILLLPIRKCYKYVPMYVFRENACRILSESVNT